MLSPIIASAKFFENYNIHYETQKNYIDSLCDELSITCNDSCCEDKRKQINNGILTANLYFEELLMHHLRPVHEAMNIQANHLTPEQEYLMQVFRTTKLEIRKLQG